MFGLPDVPAALERAGVSSWPGEPRWWGLAALVIGVGGIVTLLVFRFRRSRVTHDRVFRRLARGAGVARADRRLLRDAARRAGVRSPACLLISRGVFDHALSRHEGVVPASRVERLRSRLFPGHSLS